MITDVVPEPEVGVETPSENHPPDEPISLEVIKCIDLKVLQQKIEDLEKELEAKRVKLSEKDQEIEEWRKKCEEKVASKEIWLLIGPPYQNSRFWIGIPSPEVLLNQWHPHIHVHNWDSDKLGSYCLFWLRHGFTFWVLSGFFQKEKCHL